VESSGGRERRENIERSLYLTPDLELRKVGFRRGTRAHDAHLNGGETSAPREWTQKHVTEYRTS
jgi:hypothetical protein